MFYQFALPPYLSNIYDVFHVFHDPYHVIQLDDVQLRENLTVKTLSLRIEDHEVKHLRSKEITLVKFIWGGPVDGSLRLFLDIGFWGCRFQTVGFWQWLISTFQI